MNLILEISLIFLLILSIFIILYIREKRFNHELNKEKEKFKNIFDKSSDGISILNDGIFTECNDALVKLLRYETKKEVLNLTPSQLSPEYQEDGQKSLEKSLLMIRIAKECGINHFEWTHIKKDGTKFWADIVLTNISTNDNEVIIHALWKDIQHTKELEEELREININLENKISLALKENKHQALLLMQQSRLAQMGEMISMIAHQWRQPLNVLSLATQGINLKYKMDKLNSAEMSKFNESSQRQIKQMSNTINDFRNFFKPEKTKKIFEVSKSIYHILDLISPIYEKEKINLEVNIAASIFTNGYFNELGQTIVNLINNAKDAMLEREIENKNIKIYTHLENKKLRIIIEDNGGGIDEKIMDKIFDPYFSTKDEKNGTGLGLYMSKMIIEEHMNGKLSAINIENGVKFIIELDTVDN